nr:hypothetical protein [Tanacetum cinerariifolium]
MDTCTTLSRRVDHLELDKIAQALEIARLKRRVKKLERRNKVKVLKLRRLQKVGTTQRVETSDKTEAKEVANDTKADQDADIHRRKAESQVVDVVTTTKIITKVVTAANETITATEAQVHAATLTATPDDIRPIFEAKFNINMALLLKTKEQIEEEESRALKRLNETPVEKATKRQKLDEEVEELKRHL